MSKPMPRNVIASQIGPQGVSTEASHKLRVLGGCLITGVDFIQWGIQLTEESSINEACWAILDSFKSTGDYLTELSSRRSNVLEEE